MLERAILLATVAAMAGTVSAAAAEAPATSLSARFLNPTQSAKPRTWWHWMNGNITKAGIDADLHWMKRVGLGGVQTFDAALQTPVLVPHRLSFMTPDWKDAFNHATALAHELGLEVAIAGSPGWSETGGPWVTPKDAMKKAVWSETAVQGGAPVHLQLKAPPAVSGPFQTLLHRGVEDAQAPRFYKDQIVLAVPTGAALPQAVGASSGGPIDAARLTDADQATGVTADQVAGQATWFSLTFAQPQTIRGVTVADAVVRARFGVPAASIARLEASDDGVSFRPVANVPGTRLQQATLAFEPVTARVFRYLIDAPKPGAAATPFQLTEFRLLADMPVNRFEEKAGFATASDYYALDTTTAGPGLATRQVVDLTSRMTPDGVLTWDAPPGAWTILRFGYSLTGAQNSPASPEATGLEVDKLDPVAVGGYIKTYLDMYQGAAAGGLGKTGVAGVITDSWEAEQQNWSENLPTAFKARRGYDLTPWLPVLTGRVVQSAQASDQFLWDYRRTIGELIADSHYEVITKALHDRGMIRYGEAHETGRAVTADGMEMKRSADVPMAAMWIEPPGGEHRPELLSDIRESSSVASLYGQNIVAAESMTANTRPWATSPRIIKPTADLELVTGVNRIVYHTSVHQPLDAGPGIGLGPYGQWFTRLETWAEDAGPWITYLARSSQLLQEGRNVADVAYFYGEEAPVTALFAAGPPAMPEGHVHDFINADALAHIMSVKDHRLISKAGAAYRVLYLGGSSQRMTTGTLQALARLARQGAVIVGVAPTASPSLHDEPGAWRAAVDALWGPEPVKTVGAGRVYATQDLALALAREQVAPDARFDGPAMGAIQFRHRQTPDADIYFVLNTTQQAQSATGRFRVSGRQAEIWRADDGAMRDVSYRTQGASTLVPLTLDPGDAVFVVFRRPAKQAERTVAEPTIRPLAAAAGAWDVAFQPGRGAPATIHLDALSDLSGHADPGVRYFSGSATYTKTVTLPAAPGPKARILLDLGTVAEVAEVAVNGKPVGIAWKAPYRLDVTRAVHPGRNVVTVKVANLWANRLIGDKQPGATAIANATPNPYRAESALPPSGLIGPVQWLAQQ